MTQALLKILLVCIFVALGSIPSYIFAHNASTAYLKADGKGSRVAGVLKLDVLDVNRLIPLDLNQDGNITWSEAKAGQRQFAPIIMQQLYFSQNNLPPCYPQIIDVTAEPLNASYYLVMNWSADCEFKAGTPVTVHYNVLFDIDRSHIAIASFNGGEPQLFKAGATTRELTVKSSTPGEQFVNFLREGIWHIFIGYDHILFILTLVMAVFHMASGGLFRELLKVITAFTVAHSLTLFLVGMGILSLSSRLVESVIALSIVVGALNNLYHVLPGSTASLAFVFGLIHGFGFASVFHELNPSAASLIVAVVSFNVGVEAGQLAIVACAIPIFAALKKYGYFEFWVYKWGSVGVSLVALVWLFERVTSIAVF